MEDFFKDKVMRTFIKDSKFSWKRGLNRIPPVMFAVFINDMPEVVESYANVFANDVKILRRLQKEDKDELQQN